MSISSLSLPPLVAARETGESASPRLTSSSLRTQVGGLAARRFKGLPSLAIKSTSPSTKPVVAEGPYRLRRKILLAPLHVPSQSPSSLRAVDSEDSVSTTVSRAPSDPYTQALMSLHRSPTPPSETASSEDRDIVVVGREPDEQDRALVDTARRAIDMSYDPKIHPLVSSVLGTRGADATRGTYFIRGLQQDAATRISAWLEAHTDVSSINIEEIKSFAAANGLAFDVQGHEDPRGEDLVKLFVQQNSSIVAVFKPYDHIRGAEHCPSKSAVASKDGVPPEWEGQNEVIASGLGFQGVLMPRAIEVSLEAAFYTSGSDGPEKRTATGVLQEFISGAQPLSAIPPQKLAGITKAISAGTVQQCAIVDLWLLQADRNPGNMMFRELPEGAAAEGQDRVEIYLIDNATWASQGFLSRGYYNWMFWPGARAPFTPEALTQIAALNFTATREAIQRAYPEYPVEMLEVLQITDYLLKKGAESGLSPFQIAYLHVGQRFIFPLQAMYMAAKKAAGDDPKKTFALMQRYIARAIEMIQEHYPKIAEKVDERLAAREITEAQVSQELVAGLDRLDFTAELP